MIVWIPALILMHRTLANNAMADTGIPTMCTQGTVSGVLWITHARWRPFGAPARPCCGKRTRYDRPYMARWAIQQCMATAAAAPALMERTEPNWEMYTTSSAIDTAFSDSPGPSAPNNIRQRSGKR